jgi:hypothetical protein
MLLFAKRRDNAVPPNRCVRLLGEMLGQFDWSPWEAKYHERLGQPAIHPRVLGRVAVWSRERQRPESNRPTLHQRATPSTIAATPIDVTPRDPRRHSAGRSRQRAIPFATAFWTVVKLILAKSCIAFGPFFGVSFGCKPLIIKNLRHSPPLRGPQNNSFYFRVVFESN